MATALTQMVAGSTKPILLVEDRLEEALEEDSFVNEGGSRDEKVPFDEDWFGGCTKLHEKAQVLSDGADMIKT